jgi:mannosyltransferase
MLALLGITAAAAALRFLLLGHQGLWYDESLTAREVRLPLPALLWVVRHEEVTPPLYFVAGRIWTHLFGASVLAIRSLSALAGTLVAPLGYLAVRWLASRRAALIAAALIAVNPLLVWYSQEGRAYALLAL